jgi:hypothetical protein
MGTLNRTEFFAKDEVRQALAELKKAARRALPATDFAGREEAMLFLLDEAGRSLLEEDLQCLADGFGDRLLVEGVEYERHERGKVQYYCLGRLLRAQRHSYRRVDASKRPRSPCLSTGPVMRSSKPVSESAPIGASRDKSRAARHAPGTLFGGLRWPSR